MRLKAFKIKDSAKCQLGNLSLQVGMTVVLFVVQFLRGSGSEPSIIGSTRCSTADWSLFAGLLVICLLVTTITFIMQRREHEYKV